MYDLRVIVVTVVIQQLNIQTCTAQNWGSGGMNSGLYRKHVKWGQCTTIRSGPKKKTMILVNLLSIHNRVDVSLWNQNELRVERLDSFNLDSLSFKLNWIRCPVKFELKWNGKNQCFTLNYWTVCQLFQTHIGNQDELPVSKFCLHSIWTFLF